MKRNVSRPACDEIPLHRVGEPEEIAAFVRFLIGPESSWITGQNLSIDGGQSVRKGADYGAFAKASFGGDPKWRLVEERAPANDAMRAEDD
jgi:hypothetical protein